ncbi:chromate transporter, chromate ion transporter (CHR) family [Exiguobacterium sibiricum 255-15]|uniref:Chromate transporter, chromate ion transporter (CHR) family n=1 Tax=Exiguobacterium sibiricum (strain DSM 17290 / CCUG 55495 / CIP 109462 / JCM 13490 / 255-15) TaxID=262543 RepID=B1YLL8_EXIS2|nr:chromate efflux transporter [Exiguobacterium sibiricum]ACB61923.1 chromate transporter, chromate ion transporter (CHR) family [Exiguobacterium sibiricum 255-15]
MNRWIEIFIVSLKLGLTSFGGPVAHLGYFYEEYVKRRKWVGEKAYADLVALCQFLPGPASSQVGMGIGLVRGGVVGAIVSFIGFTLPSSILLILFAVLATEFDLTEAGFIHGLKLVAVAIVADAVLGMGTKLAVGPKRLFLMLLALAGVLLIAHPLAQVGVLLLAAVLGLFLFKDEPESGGGLNIRVPKWLSISALILFIVLLVVTPFLAANAAGNLQLTSIMYSAGALVFGGGHVVLPFLQQSLVPDFLTGDSFLAGYAAAQAVPGPLFTFATYLGTVVNGLMGGILATLAIFLPGFLLVLGVLPFWDRVRGNKQVGRMLIGVNAAVVGILLAALYDPIFTSSVKTGIDFLIVFGLFCLLRFYKQSPLRIVILGAVMGSIMGWF